jgi:hypothetical protein
MEQTNKGEEIMKKYEVIPHKLWVHKITGHRVSIWGASPWCFAADKINWEIKQFGWTVLNPITGIIGICQQPWGTQEAAQAYADTHKPITFSYGD